MMDLLFLAATAGFFATCGALIRLAERLMPDAPAAGPTDDRSAPPAR